MNLQDRIDILHQLGRYMLSADPQWVEAKERAGRQNGWFIPEFVDLATEQIAREFLQRDLLEAWVSSYPGADRAQPRTVGIVMAGNIPLVGFHDLLCCFIAGHRSIVKTSSKDSVLITELLNKLVEWDPAIADRIQFSTMLKGCDAYIATGSNNTAGYFDYYFAKYPHIIRRNRTSVAVLDGHEAEEELAMLADDVYLYFGLGCRNVTKIYVPGDYDFRPLLDAFKKYDYLIENQKYKNNYDYNLSLHLLNRKFFMSNESLLVVEDASLFSPISQLNYAYYTGRDSLVSTLKGNEVLQCLVGHGQTPFGQAQYPTLSDYADGVDTMDFLTNL